MRVISIVVAVALMLIIPAAHAAAPTSAAVAKTSSLKTLRLEERVTSELLRDVKTQLDQISTVRIKRDAGQSGLTRAARKRRLEGLHDLQKKYQARIANLSASLTDVTTQLTTQGGRTGNERIGALETELSDSLHEQFDAQREVDRLSASIEKNKDKGDQSKAIKDLESHKDQAASQVEKLKDRVASAKKNLAQLAGGEHEQRNLLDSEKQARSRLQEIEQEIEQLELAERTEGDPDALHKDREIQLQERSVQLNNLKTKYEFQLRNLREDLRDAEASEVAAIFPDFVDVYLVADELANDKPSIAGVRFDGAYELNDRTFVRLKNDSATWTVDPSKVIAVRGRSESK